MKIGIDARFYNESGVGRYLRNLITNLKEIDQTNSYFIFLLPKDFKDFSETKNFKKIVADFSWYSLSEQINMPKILNSYQLDLMHFPHFNVPIFYRKRFIVTIHDLIHQHFQMKRATTLNPLTYKVKQLGYKKVFQHAIRKSEKIIVPSDYVKNSLIEEWKVKSEKITVTYEAVDRDILSLINNISKNQIDQTMKSFEIDPPYIFYVGNAHPHKNVENLIKAFLDLRKNYQYLQLVLAGNSHYFWQQIQKKYTNKNIKFIGKVSDEQLVALYKNSQAFVMPSLEEGFGIPILEAMACDTPVVSSNKGSLKEIGGDAAIYFDPTNISDMTTKIDEVLKSEKIKKELIKEGHKKFEQFDFKKMAKQTLEIYNKSI